MADTNGVNKVGYIGGGVNTNIEKLERFEKADTDSPLFQELDTDGDGKLSTGELSEAGIIKDPIITIKNPTDIGVEFKKQPEENSGKAKLDADGDGEISEEEMVAFVKRMLAKKDDISEKLDANGDGKISQAEIKKYNRNKMFTLLEEEVNMYDQLIKLNVKNPADIDGDGEISDAEQKAYNTGDYTEILDANGDGAITEKELEEYNKMQAPKIIGKEIDDILENPYLF